MRDGNVAIGGAGYTTARNDFLVVRRGECLGEAVRRHWRVNGKGTLLLMRDFNVAAAGRQTRPQAVA